MSTQNTTRNTTRSTPKSTTVYTIDNLQVTPELYYNIQSRFPKLTVTPKSSMEEIQFNAGQQSVIELLKALVGSRVLSGDPRLTIKPKTYLNRTTEFLRKFTHDSSSECTD